MNGWHLYPGYKEHSTVGQNEQTMEQKGPQTRETTLMSTRVCIERIDALLTATFIIQERVPGFVCLHC